MTDERTPLLAVVHVAPARPVRPQYRHSRIRRACTCLLTTILVLSITAAILVLTLVPDCRNNRHRNHPCLPKHPFYRDNNQHNRDYFSIQSDPIGYEDLIAILSSTPNETKAKEWSKYYTSGPHLAGKNLSQAEWTQDRWDEFGIPHTEIVAYEIYLNYPRDHRLALLEESGNGTGKDHLDDSKKTEWKVKYEASLEEDVLEEDETTGLKDRIPTFHGYSANGNVTAQYVFVNYGTYHDFEDLTNANISLKGKIALIKYGGIFRGLKVKRAQDLGMVGAVIYTDPGDDLNVTEVNGYKPYPEGPARNPSSVQRGSVQFLSIAPGDPTSIGFPCKPGCKRQNPNQTIPSIPSIPISYQDALPLLKALNGHGPTAKSFGSYWDRGGLGHKGVEYSIGPSPKSLALNLYNDQEYVITPIWNVIGIINGTNQDEVVVLGNHRDAWVLGGSGDPNSGSAALNEVVRSFGVALAKGWKPLRTIVFASFDGEEIGLTGSTEWVEDHLPWLNKSAVAYLNVDVGTSGPNFKLSSTPLLQNVVVESAKLVLSPNQTKIGQTVYDVWDKKINTLGSGSDYTAFLDHAGITAIDMGFSADESSAVYHYHSNYDSFHWMNRYGDPSFAHHVTIARLWALVAAKLSESPLIPLSTTDYADALLGYFDAVKKKAGNSTAFDGYSPLDGLDLSLKRLRNTTIQFDAQAAALMKEIADNPIPWWKFWERIKLHRRVNKVNDGYKYFERHFLYKNGLEGRPWYRHMVFAPGKWTGYSGVTLPGLAEAIDNGEIGKLWKYSSIILASVEKARASLPLDV